MNIEILNFLLEFVAELKNTRITLRFDIQSSRQRKWRENIGALRLLTLNLSITIRIKLRLIRLVNNLKVKK